MTREDEKNLILLEQGIKDLKRLVEEQSQLIVDLRQQVAQLEQQRTELQKEHLQERRRNDKLFLARILQEDESAGRVRHQITEMINKIDRSLALLNHC